MNSSWSENKKKEYLFKNSMKYYNKEDIVIFGCESLIVKNNIKKSIAIQHGISWDIRGHENLNHFQNLLFVFLRAYRATKIINRITRVKRLICVDYNFINWYRTQVAYTEVVLDAIPNCTIVPPYKNRTSVNKEINIIFARRFKKQRGTRLIAEVIDRVLNDFNNVNITFAGEGPDEKLLKEKFKDNKNVKFIAYDSEKSIEIHQNHDIAVIPTIGSEGTSFSLLEAMASQCAVVASNVGGMTNIILDGFNGLLVNPDNDSFYLGLNKLISDYNFRKMISENAYSTISEAFNFEIWSQRWEKILKEEM